MSTPFKIQYSIYLLLFDTLSTLTECGFRWKPAVAFSGSKPELADMVFIQGIAIETRAKVIKKYS